MHGGMEGVWGGGRAPPVQCRCTITFDALHVERRKDRKEMKVCAKSYIRAINVSWKILKVKWNVRDH